MSYFDEDGHLDDNWIAAYISAMQDQSLHQIPDEVRDHVEDCSFCTKLIMSLTAFNAHDQSTGEQINEVIETASHHEKNRIHSLSGNLFLRIAAIVIVLVTVGSVLFFYMQNNDRDKIPGIARNNSPLKIQNTTTDSTPVPNKGNTVRTEDKSKLLAANYTELPYMEEMIKENQRNVAFTLLLPDREVVYADSLMFRWKPVKGTVKLTIRNNRDNTIKEDIITGESYILKDHFAPGLYYWLITVNDDVVKAGKFKITH
jgi:hypothetical protein